MPLYSFYSLTHPLVVAGDHGAHGEAHALVVVGDVGEDLGGGGHGDALAVAQLVEATLLGEHALPVGAVGRAAGHRAQQEPGEKEKEN